MAPTLWQAIAERETVSLWLGEYHEVSDQPRPPHRWISRRDTEFANQIVRLLSNPEKCGVAKTPTIINRYRITIDGRWENCKWIDKKQDAGIVIIQYDPGTNGILMVAFGFSGSGTTTLGKNLLYKATDFWPPYHKYRNKKIGIYICEMKFKKKPKLGKFYINTAVSINIMVIFNINICIMDS